MNGWSLVYEGFDPAQERLRESLCTLGNGYFATRGAAPESAAGPVHYPGTYVAGCYDRLPSVVDGRTLEHVEVLSYRQQLDLRRGVLVRDLRVRDTEGRTTRVRSTRLVHMGSPHLAALDTSITAEDWSGPLEIRAALDGRVVNDLVGRYRHLAKDHLVPVDTAAIGDESILLKVRSWQSDIVIAQAARIRAFHGDRPVGGARPVVQEGGYVARDAVVDVEAGTPVRIEKVVALYTSRDRAISECGLEARTAIGRAGSFRELLRAHALTWKHLWRAFDMRLEVDIDPVTPANGAVATSALVRLHIFHLLQTASPHTHDLDAGVPARGLHGEAYRGHVFWDELFIFPFLNLRMPEITRALLLYRYRRLDEARVAARAAGYRGAMFPWQSGSNGREETDRQFFNPRSGRFIPDHSHLHRPLQALEAAGRAHAVLSLLRRGAPVALGAPGLPVRRPDDPAQHQVLLPAERPRLLSQPGGRHLGPGPRRPARVVGRLHGSPRDRRGGHPGRHDAGGHPPRGHGRDGRRPAALLHGDRAARRRALAHPRLPKPLRCLRLFVRYRAQSLAIELRADTVSVHALHCVAPSVRVGVNGEIHDVGASETRRFRLT